MTDLPHMKKPCPECPWRRDTPPGKFPPERYEALRNTSGRPGNEVGVQAPIFACHMTHEGKDKACAGWLATVGCEHIGIRLAVAMNRLDPDTLRPHAGWPELFDSYDDMAATQGRDD